MPKTMGGVRQRLEAVRQRHHRLGHLDALQLALPGIPEAVAAAVKPKTIRGRDLGGKHNGTSRKNN